MGLTGTREDYIRALYKIGGFNNTAVRVGDLAEFLQLAKSTVSERLKELISISYVEADPDSSGYVLTKKGLRVAKALTYKHRIIESFLHDVLDVDESKVHNEACRLEHACSEEVIARMSQYLGNPTKDPHGQPIKK